MAINISTRDRLYVSNEAKSRFRKSATASAAGSLEEQGCAATVNASRSILLGVFVKDLVSLARRTTCRPVGNVGVRQLTRAFVVLFAGCARPIRCIVGERHLRRVVANYVRYYNSVRTHMSLAKDAPDPVLSMAPGEGE